MFINSIFVLGVVFISIAVPVCIGLYVYQDSKNHGMEPILWTALAVFVPYCIGLIFYLVMRQSRSTIRCSRCNTVVKDSYTVCPQCGTSLKETCPSCGAYVEPNWRMCAHCGTELPHYNTYEVYDSANTAAPNTTGSIITKGLIIAAVITIVIAVFFLLQFATLGGMNHMHGVNFFMRHL